MKQEIIYYMLGKSLSSAVLIAVSSKGLCALLIGDNTSFLIRDFKNRFSKALLIEDREKLEDLYQKILKFIKNPKEPLRLPLDERGTAFQKAVWRAVRDLKEDETSTYKEIAKKIKRPNAYRAVGTACKKNLLYFLTPCERVKHSGEKNREDSKPDSVS